MHGPLQNHPSQSFMQVEPNFMVTNIGANDLRRSVNLSPPGQFSLPSKKAAFLWLMLWDRQVAP
jgi:hypothetical protein